LKNIIEITDLAHFYGKNQTLENVNFCLQEKEIVGLVGKNGAGKTTLMKLILGTEKPRLGSVRLFEENIDTEKQRIKALQKIGTTIEYPAAYSHLTGKENLRYFASFYEKSSLAFVNELVEIVGLSKYIDTKFGNYSLGTKQKFALCLAFIHQPKLLLLDEPTNGLDPWTVNEIKKIIIDLNTTFGTSFLISSHIISDLADVCSSLAVIKNKKLEGISLHETTNLTVQIKFKELTEEQRMALIHYFKNAVVQNNCIVFESISVEIIPQIINELVGFSCSITEVKHSPNFSSKIP
jgi:ABC-type multidrug transport system ATPase subunit